MDVRPEIARIEQDLATRGLSVARLCREAGIAQTTWGRWKNGDTSATADAWAKVCAAHGVLQSSYQAQGHAA